MIIPIFIMNRGCPRRCLFCNERLTAGERPQQSHGSGEFGETIRARLRSAGRRGRPCPDRLLRRDVHRHGAGGTAAPPRHGVALSPGGAVDGIRLSTRPDEIDTEASTSSRPLA